MLPLSKADYGSNIPIMRWIQEYKYNISKNGGVIESCKDRYYRQSGRVGKWRFGGWEIIRHFTVYYCSYTSRNLLFAAFVSAIMRFQGGSSATDLRWFGSHEGGALFDVIEEGCAWQ